MRIRPAQRGKGLREKRIKLQHFLVTANCLVVIALKEGQIFFRPKKDRGERIEPPRYLDMFTPFLKSAQVCKVVKPKPVVSCCVTWIDFDGPPEQALCLAPFPIVVEAKKAHGG